MKTFLFFILAGYAVRCDDSNYYVVQMPDNDVLPTKDFKVYWNVPTMQCKSKKIFFDDLYEKYGITQNTGDTFRGDKISILYDPGDFPALLRNSSSGEIKYRNGGVPQEGDLIKHLNTFQKFLEQSVPDTNFNGVGIIDFESWRPVLRQNFGILTPYKDVSYEIEKKKHWWWKKQWIEEEAKRRFEGAAREFIQATVSLARKMRPHAVWGYYGFPYCFNMGKTMIEACADKVPEENDGTSWLWQESTALYPSIYSPEDFTANQLAGLIRGRVKEAARVAVRGAPILPYFWYRYRDKGYFSESDLDVAFRTIYKSNASGFIIWGSSNDVNTIGKCKKLKQYITDTFGPAVAKYTKRNMRLGDEPDETFTGIYNPNNASKFDPEYTWIPPVNYTQKIEEMVDKELKEAAVKHKNSNESILVDMILHKIANYCAEGCDNKSKVRQTDEKEGDGGINESRVVLVTEDPFKTNSSGTAVTVSTTSEEDIYDYDLNTEDVTLEDIYETNEYIEVSTSSKSRTSTTMKRIEELGTTTSTAEDISIFDNSNEKSGTFNIYKEQNSTVDISTDRSSTIAIETTESEENNNNRLEIEKNNAIDLSIEETNSTEGSTTDMSTTTVSAINNISSTESTIRLSSEWTSLITNALGIDENNTESNSIEVDFIDVSTEESSTINTSSINEGTPFIKSADVEPRAVYSGSTYKPNAVVNRTIIEPSDIDNDTTDQPSTVIENNNAIDLSIEKPNSTEGSTTEIITTTVSTINDISSTESTIRLSPEWTSVITSDLGIDENNTELNSIAVDFTYVSTEESSKINPSSVDDGTTFIKSVDFEPIAYYSGSTYKPNAVVNGTIIEPSDIDNDTTDIPSAVDKGTTYEPSTVDTGTTDEPSAVDNGTIDEPSAVGTESDSSTTLAPVLTEQVLGSVSRAIVSKTWMRLAPKSGDWHKKRKAYAQQWAKLDCG